MAATVTAKPDSKPKQVSGDGLDVFYGEFLVSPIPLELSFNYCSHKCAYCFANLNKPDRWADVKAVTRLLQDYRNRETLTAQLLKAGYPVLISNRVDPFAASNYQQAVPIITTMAEMGIPLALQTKGGRGIDDVLSVLPPSAWYISIGTLDDSIRKRIEPGAPTIESRFELIEKLTAKGHHVSLGLNPLVPEWCPNPEALLDRARASGAKGVWAERLHLNHKQVVNLSERERGGMTEDVIKRAQKRTTTPPELALYDSARAYAQSIGLEVYGIAQPIASDYFEPYKKLYPKVFPTIQDFVNATYRGDFGEVIDFDQFADFMCAFLPKGEMPIDHYLGATAHTLWHTNKIPKRMTYRQLLSIVWSDLRIHRCPARMRCFAFQAERDSDGGWIRITDNNDLPYLVFDPQGFDEYYTEVEY